MLVCHCHRVSDQQIVEVLDAGAHRVGQVVRATRAGTDCGGCLPALRRLCEGYVAQRDAAEQLTQTG